MEHKLTEAEIDELVVAQADDDSAWEEPICVQPPLSGLDPLSLKERIERWHQWLADNQQLNDTILIRREGQPVDIDTIWEASREDLENRTNCSSS